MSKRTLCNYNCNCNCHWSRQVSYMRHCWNRIFFTVIRVMVVINQITIMSPFIYLKNSKANSISSAPKTAVQFAKSDVAVQWKFRTQRLLTALAIILFAFYAAATPFMVKTASQVYLSLRSKRDNVFIAVAIFTMTMDVLCFLLIMATNIWHRETIVKLLNYFNEIMARFEQLDKNLIRFKIFLTLVAKTTLIAYEIVTSLPLLAATASRYSTQSVVAFLFTHYLRMLGYIFELSIFICILLLLTCSLQLEKELQCSQVTSNDVYMLQLRGLQDSLQRLMSLFRATFQFGIFLTILLYFVSILCNIFAMLDYYVDSKRGFGTFITYLLSLAVELYSLIYVVYLCDRSQRKVKDLFLQREEFCFLQAPRSVSTVDDMDVLWPILQEFQLLGLFTLNHEFALFILAYSVNFVVIILEFEVNKAQT